MAQPGGTFCPVVWLLTGSQSVSPFQSSWCKQNSSNRLAPFKHAHRVFGRSPSRGQMQDGASRETRQEGSAGRERGGRIHLPLASHARGNTIQKQAAPYHYCYKNMIHFLINKSALLGRGGLLFSVPLPNHPQPPPPADGESNPITKLEPVEA